MLVHYGLLEEGRAERVEEHHAPQHHSVVHLPERPEEQREV